MRTLVGLAAEKAAINNLSTQMLTLRGRMHDDLRDPKTRKARCTWRFDLIYEDSGQKSILLWGSLTWEAVYKRVVGHNCNYTTVSSLDYKSAFWSGYETGDLNATLNATGKVV